MLLCSLVKYPLNDKNPIAVLSFLISCLWLDRVREGSGGREDESVEDCMKRQRANEGMESRGISPKERENPPLVTECRQETISADISAPAGHTERESSPHFKGHRASPGLRRWALNSVGRYLQWLCSV